MQSPAEVVQDAASIFSTLILISTNSNIWFTTCANGIHLYSLPKTLALCYFSLKLSNSVKVWCPSFKGSGDGIRGQRNYNLNKGAALLMWWWRHTCPCTLWCHWCCFWWPLCPASPWWLSAGGEVSQSCDLWRSITAWQLSHAAWARAS